jgi:hypothetical protein
MKNIIVLLLLIGVTGCATFNNKYVTGRTQLQHDNIGSYNGTYNLRTDSTYNKKGILEPVINQHGNFSLYSVITNKILKLDSLASYSARVSFQDHQIQFDFYKGAEKFETVIIRAKLKSDGMYYLDNSQTTVFGVPYIYGRTSHNKTRLGIDRAGNLFVNTAGSQYGAVLFIIGDGNAYNFCPVFKAAK